MRYALILLLLITLIVIGFGCHATLHEETGPLLGQGRWTTVEAPDLTGRWTLLAFFLPDCEGCALQAPELIKVREAYTPFGVSIVGVTLASRFDAKDFVNEHGLPYPVLAAARAEFELYGVREVPDTFLVNPQGVVVARGLERIREALFTKFGE